VIRDDFVGFIGQEEDADDDLAELLDEDGSDDVPSCDAVAFYDFLGWVNAVFIEPGPGLHVEEVEDARVEPICDDGKSEGEVLVRHEWHERRS